MALNPFYKRLVQANIPDGLLIKMEKIPQAALLLYVIVARQQYEQAVVGFIFNQVAQPSQIVLFTNPAPLPSLFTKNPRQLIPAHPLFAESVGYAIFKSDLFVGAMTQLLNPTAYVMRTPWIGGQDYPDHC